MLTLRVRKALLAMIGPDQPAWLCSIEHGRFTVPMIRRFCARPPSRTLVGLDGGRKGNLQLAGKRSPRFTRGDRTAGPGCSSAQLRHLGQTFLQILGIHDRGQRHGRVQPHEERLHQERNL